MMSRQSLSIRGGQRWATTWIALAALALAALGFAQGWATNAPLPSTIVAQVSGMACPFCAYGLRKELLTIPGVASVRVSLSKSRATVTVRQGTNITDDQIRQAIRQAGFSPGAIHRGKGSS